MKKAIIKRIHVMMFLYVRCAESSNRIAADDNPMKLMSLAMKPVSFPPFPLERMEEMTRLMGGSGTLE